MPTQYPYTYKAIFSHNKLINYIVILKNISAPVMLYDMSITLEMIITGYPKVL